MAEQCKRTSSVIMKELVANKRANPNILFPLCQELHNYALTHEEPYSDAFSLLYFSIAYLRSSQLKPCIDYGRKAHMIQTECCFLDLLPLLDNVLGCAFTYRGDFQSGMTYFYEGIHYAESGNDYYLLSALYSNIAELYRLAGANEYALDYARKAQQTLLKTSTNTNNIAFDDMQFQLDLLQIHFALQNTAMVDFILATCQNLLCNKFTYAEYATRFYTIEAQIRYERGEDFSSIFLSLKQALAAIDINKKMDYISAFWSYYDAIGLIYQYLSSEKCLSGTDEWEEISSYCITQLNPFYDIAVYLNQAYLWIRYDELKIQLYELMHRLSYEQSSCRVTCKLQLLATYQHYYEQCILRDKENKDEQLSRLKDRLTLYETQKENSLNRRRAVRLKLESEQDALTKCANRYGLQVFMQTYFDYTKEEKKTFACSIIDIDYFKQYNDTYGHLAGDECIRQIADAIRAAQNDEGFLVRYGGDEFVLFHIGKTNEEMLEISQSIKKAVASLQIPHSSSKVAAYVTISMGVVNCVPSFTAHSNDFLHAADKALYKVKKTSKNHFQIAYDL